jgi:dihydropteroate synthase
MHLDLSKKPLVMGILNATPDSFSDGGELNNQKSLGSRIAQIITEGADVIDIGGESTRPGFMPVKADEEIKRVVPVIEAVRKQNKLIPISIDTQKAFVAEAAMKAGATIINDVSGLSDLDMGGVVKRYNCPVVIMRNLALEEDIIDSCKKQFRKLIAKAKQAGIRNEQIILDPGLGFGDLPSQNFKALPGGNIEANLELARGIKDYSLGFPVLIGGSRKRFIGNMMNEPDPKKRLSGSIELAILAARSGASIIRVHDVKETVSALKKFSYQK